MIMFPAGIGIGEVSLASNNPSYVSESLNLTRWITAIPTHRWEFTIKTVPLENAKSRRFSAFVNSLEGQFNDFYIALPIYKTPAGIGGGAAQTNGQPASNQLQITGAPASTPGWLAAGDYINITNHSKIYQVIEDVNTAGNGDAVINLNTDIMFDPGVGVPVTIDNIYWRVILEGPVQRYTISAPREEVIFELDCVEYLN